MEDPSVISGLSKLVGGRTIHWEGTWEGAGWWWTQSLRQFICLCACSPAPSQFRALEGSEHNVLVFEPPQHPAQSHASPCRLNSHSSAGISVVSEWVGKVWVETLSWLCPQGEGGGSWYKNPGKAGVGLGLYGTARASSQGCRGPPAAPARFPLLGVSCAHGRHRL